jgi:hypothetical protein
LSAAPSAPEPRRGDPRQGDREDPAQRPERRARPQPGALELLRWSLILMGISLLVAAVAIPLLRWLDLD